MLSIIIIGMHACTVIVYMHGCLYQLDFMILHACLVCRDPKILTLNMSQDFSILTEPQPHPQFFKITHMRRNTIWLDSSDA